VPRRSPQRYPGGRRQSATEPRQGKRLQQPRRELAGGKSESANSYSTNVGAGVVPETNTRGVGMTIKSLKAIDQTAATGHTHALTFESTDERQRRTVLVFFVIHLSDLPFLCFWCLRQEVRKASAFPI